MEICAVRYSLHFFQLYPKQYDSGLATAATRTYNTGGIHGGTMKHGLLFCTTPPRARWRQASRGGNRRSGSVDRLSDQPVNARHQPYFYPDRSKRGTIFNGAPKLHATAGVHHATEFSEIFQRLLTRGAQFYWCMPGSTKADVINCVRLTRQENPVTYSRSTLFYICQNNMLGSQSIQLGSPPICQKYFPCKAESPTPIVAASVHACVSRTRQRTSSRPVGLDGQQLNYFEEKPRAAKNLLAAKRVPV